MIISTRTEGLANRMKSLVSCFRLDSDSRVYWEPEVNIYLKNKEGEKVPHRPPATFNDLFDNPIAIDKPFPRHAKIYNSWRLVVKRTDKVPKDFSQSTFSDADPEGRNIDFEYNRISKRMMNIYIEEFKKLQVKQELMDKINQKVEEMENDFVAVHFRAWADVAGRKRRDPTAFDKFVEEMRNYKKGTRFFVGSDSDEAIQKFAEIFPNRIFFLNEERTQQNDLVDLYILSKGSRLIGTKNSTLSEVAWWLSECNKHVRII